MSIADVIGQQGFNANLPHYRKVLSGQPVNYTSSFIKLDGDTHYYRALYAPLIQNGEILGFTGVVVDISAETELNRLSKSDALTNLNNRRCFEEHINELLTPATQSPTISHGLIFIDVDFFKSINDNYGHNVGDKALIRLAKILRESTNAAGNAYRIGGEEFALILPQIDNECALLQKAEELRLLVQSSQLISERQITISLGVVLFKSSETRNGILKRADVALYASKNNGRNQVQFIK